MPGTLVRQKPSITIVPRSVLTPSFSSPRPSTLPTTPTAEITRSAATDCFWAFASSMCATTPSAFFSTAATLAPVDILMLLLEGFARERRYLGVLGGKDLRQHFDDRDVGAEGAEERSEFDADRARADDEQRFRNFVRHHRFEIGPYEFLIRLDAGEHARAG